MALFGRVVAVLVDRAPRRSAPLELVFGLTLVSAAVLLVFLGSTLALAALDAVNAFLGILLGAALLKTSFSLRQLEQEAVRAAELLERDGVGAARGPLSALVSRDLDGLSPRLAASAVIESLAENLSDSFVAPLFYYVLLGVPGALAYRAINTLDAMVGYHGRFEHLGRAAAKLDDLVNLVPARLTAALFVLAAELTGSDGRRGLTIGLRDHSRTESPNAGWPMAVIAGALHTELEKRGHYRIGEPGQQPDPAMIRRTVSVIRCGAVLTCVLALLGLVWISGAR